jgi:hypothetical protein
MATQIKTSAHQSKADKANAVQRDWGLDVVKAMFPRSAFPNLGLHFQRIEKALDDEIRKAKISAPQDILTLKLYAYATIRVENAGCSTHDERVSRWNTAQHKSAPPVDFASVKPVHAMYEAIITQYGLDRPFGKYDYRSDLHNHAPGMGAKYKGRGFIQLTGYKNYVNYAARAPAPDIVERPERAGESRCCRADPRSICTSQ